MLENSGEFILWFKESLPARILILEVTKLRLLYYLYLGGNEFIRPFIFPQTFSKGMLFFLNF